jgi:hypothetical protein
MRSGGDDSARAGSILDALQMVCTDVPVAPTKWSKWSGFGFQFFFIFPFFPVQTVNRETAAIGV